MCAAQHESLPGQLVNLLRVAAEGGVEPATRQVAAITLKNLVRRSWEVTGGRGGCGARSGGGAQPPRSVCRAQQLGRCSPHQPPGVPTVAAEPSDIKQASAEDQALVRGSLFEALLRCAPPIGRQPCSLSRKEPCQQPAACTQPPRAGRMCGMAACAWRRACARALQGPQSRAGAAGRGVQDHRELGLP